jgi:hypothetical protein
MSLASLTVICQDCGNPFFVVPSEHWKRVCRFCYRREMDARKQVESLERTVDSLRRENSRLRLGGSGASLDRHRLRQLLQLCHPDKHDGSKTATEITQWLLSQRGSA